MPESTAIVLTPKERFMLAAREEMAKFERREADLRKNLQNERARELSLPLHLEGVH